MMDGNDDYFLGLTNTEELISVANELLLEQMLEYKIDHVHGTISRFKAKVVSQISNGDQVQDFIRTYIRQNNETLRISKKRKLTERSSSVKTGFLLHKFEQQTMATMEKNNGPIVQ